MRMVRPRTRLRCCWVLGATALLIQVSCGNNDNEVDAGADGTADVDRAEALAESSWVSTDVEGHELQAGTAISLAFTGSELRANAGCNTMSGSYDVADGALRVDGLASTEMGCQPPERHDQDEWLARVLTSEPTVELGEESLYLRTDEVSLRFVDERVVDPDRELTGVTWTLETLIEGDRASSVPEGVDVPTLQVAEDGTAELFAGCNMGSGTLRADGGTLELALVVTDMACEDEAMAVEEHVLEVLGGAFAAFEIEGSRLHVSAGERALEFTPPPAED